MAPRAAVPGPFGRRCARLPGGTGQRWDVFIVNLLRELPSWCFHGTKDDVIPVRESRRPIERVRAIGAKGLRYTEYPELQHDRWTRAYNPLDLRQWMLQQRRAPAKE